MAFIVMKWKGLNANIMSLGGHSPCYCDMSDGAVVMVENATNTLLQPLRKNRPN